MESLSSFWDTAEFETAVLPHVEGGFVIGSIDMPTKG